MYICYIFIFPVICFRRSPLLPCPSSFSSVLTSSLQFSRCSPLISSVFFLCLTSVSVGREEPLQLLQSLLSRQSSCAAVCHRLRELQTFHLPASSVLHTHGQCKTPIFAAYGNLALSTFHSYDQQPQPLLCSIDMPYSNQVGKQPRFVPPMSLLSAEAFTSLMSFIGKISESTPIE